MLLAAIAHLFAFSHRPFIDLAASSEPCCFSFMRIIDLTDERIDINDHFRQIGNLIQFVFDDKKNCLSLGSRVRNVWRHRESGFYDEDEGTSIPLRPRQSNIKEYHSNDFVPL